MAETKSYLAPPRPLLTRNPLLWLQFFGPGAVIASLTIGSGELLFPSRLGAIFDYRLLWIFPLVALLKWFMAYCSARHMILSGAHPLERWNEIPGPRGWLPLFFFLIYIVCAPFWQFFMAGLLGSICVSIFPWGDWYFWATVWGLVSFVLLYVGNYTFLERTQMLILGLMLICILIAVVYVQPNWLKVLQGFFIQQPPDYPDWLHQRYDSFRNRSAWVELVVAASVIGGSAGDYLCYVSFLREKRWGRSDMGIADEDEIREIAGDDRHPARLWVRAALIDTTLSMLMIVLIAACFSILGAVILQPQQLVPAKDEELLIHQGQFLSTLSPLLLPLYQLAVFLAFFGNVYGGPEVTGRVSCEFVHALPRRWNWFSQPRIRWLAICWTLFGGLAIVWLKRGFPDTRMVDVMTFPAIYTGILMCGLFCLVNPWIDWHFLPAQLHMNWVLAVLNIAAGVIFCIFGMKAIWDESRWHLVVLPGSILGAMLLAYLLRPKDPLPEREC